MRSIFALALCLFLSVSCFAQETVVNIDLSQLDITGFPEEKIFIKYASYSRRIPVEKKVISLKVKNLPTLIEVRTLNKHKFTTHKMIWVEQSDLVIEGSIQEKTITPVPYSDLQTITDQISQNKKPDPVKEADLAYSQPYMVYLNRQRSFLKNKYLSQVVDKAPESVRGFWAFQSLAGYMEEQKLVGYDPDTKVFSHLTATNKAREEQRIELSGEKPILIDFSSSSCRPCLMDIPKMVAIHEEYGDRLDMLTMWDDPTYETWTKVTPKLKAQIVWNSLWDEKGVIYKRFNIKVFPTYALFDKSGKLIKTWHKPPKKIGKYL